MEDNKDKLCGNVCADERFDMIARVKGELMRSTNIETNKKEMKVFCTPYPSAYVMSPMDLHETMKCVATTCLRLGHGEEQEPPRTETSAVEKIDIGEITKGNFVRIQTDDATCVVTGIHPDGSVELTRDDGASKLTRFQCHVYSLAPIPLTDGILEKTGFHHCMPYNDWTNDTVDLILYDAADGYGVQNTSITIRYVHQFQNLLKQCKTKIEVKL